MQNIETITYRVNLVLQPLGYDVERRERQNICAFMLAELPDFQESEPVMRVRFDVTIRPQL